LIYEENLHNAKTMEKVLDQDTSVLLHKAGAISSFSDNVVVMPMTRIEELDKFKSRNDEKLTL
jgi:predicted ribonuclease YlaK